MQYSLDDYTIIPEVLCDIEHRSECKLEYIPIMASPMTAVISVENASIFRDTGITTIIPRSVAWDTRLDLSVNKQFIIAVSLTEAEELFNNYKQQVANNTVYNNPEHTIFKNGILIDMANGHMKRLYNLAADIKKHVKESYLIIGNIANPQTYEKYLKIGVDGVRVGIGSGSACITSSNVGVHAGLGSLIKECSDIKRQYKDRCYTDKNVGAIIADGGIGTYDQMVKALALGADYVMLGKMLAQTDEAAGKTIVEYNKKPILYPLMDNAHKKEALTEVRSWQLHGYINDLTIMFANVRREYYGMSTRKAQEEFSNNSKDGSANRAKTAEGIETTVPVLYSISSFLNNFKDYLRSAMSYTNSRSLEEFIGRVKVDTMTEREFKSYYK